MNTTTKITLDELKNLPPLSDEEKNRLSSLSATPTEDAPALSKEQLSKCRPMFETHPELYNQIIRVKKVDVHLKIDADVLAALKEGGKGYQTRINEILRKAVFG